MSKAKPEEPSMRDCGTIFDYYNTDKNKFRFNVGRAVRRLTADKMSGRLLTRLTADGTRLAIALVRRGGWMEAGTLGRERYG